MLPCTQCGNTVVVDEGSTFVRCFNCNQAAFACDDRLVPFFRLRPTLDLIEATALMKGWMEAQAGPAKLNGEMAFGQAKAYEFLFWSFSGGEIGYDRQSLVPAVKTVLRELRNVEIPARFVVPEPSYDGDEETAAPTVPLESALSQVGGTEEDGLQTWLIRVPLFEFPYNYNGRSYRIIVDGLSGQCLVDRFPRRPVSTWLTVMAACIAAFAVEGWVLWGSGPWLAAAYLFTAVPAAAITWSIMRKRREAEE